MAESSTEVVDALERENLAEDLKACDENCDFVIKVRDVSYPVHQNILISSTEYFRGMLAHDTKERQDGFVKIKEIDSQTMKSCIDFMYDRDIDITMETAKTLLPTAEFLQLTELSKRCVDVLEENLYSGNCITVLKLARAYNCYELAEKALDIFKEEFKMENYEDFCKLDKKGIKQHINDLDMEIAWDGIINWIKLDVENRSSDIVELGKTLSLKAFPSSGFLHSVWREPFFINSEFCKNLVFRRLFLNNDVLKKEINIENCLIIEKISHDFDFLNDDAKEVILHFMEINFLKIMSNDEFVLLPSETVLRLFPNAEVGLCGEIVRWNAAMKWMKRNPDQKESFYELLKCIEFNKIPQNFIKSKVCSDPLLGEIQDFHKIVFDCFLTCLNDDTHLTVLNSDRRIYAWNMSDEAWRQLPDCPANKNNIKMFSFCGKLCILADNELFYLGRNETEWIPRAALKHRPDRLSTVVASTDKIYVVEKERMSSYDPNTDIWDESLPGCDMDGKLFAGCTNDRICVRSTVGQECCYFLKRRYFFKAQDWSQLVNGKKQISDNAATAFHNGKIFIVGLKGAREYNSVRWLYDRVECYSDAWKNMNNIPVSITSPAHLFFVDERLFLLVSGILYFYIDVFDKWVHFGVLPQYISLGMTKSLDPVSVCSFKGNLGNAPTVHMKK